MPCRMLPEVQDLDQRGFGESGKRCFAQESLHSFAERLLVTRGPHDNMAIRHAIGKRGGQVFLDGNFASRRGPDAFVDDTDSTLANHGKDAVFAEAHADRQRDPTVGRIDVCASR